ncbi:hypothetical protein G6514_005844 [Epicoccum nigrum]|nr:hypothetical protein G6514_005844 [Epicoccum nigrum]
MSTISQADDEFFRYLDDADINTSGLAALNQLDEFIRETGPYDALFAFSEGAGLAASLLIRMARLNGSSIAAAAGVGVEYVAGGIQGPGADLHLIKCAVFFSAGVPRDPETGRLMDAAIDGEVIDVPTAHIWGENDNMYPSFGPVLSRLCKTDVKEVYVHDGGHRIPGAGDMEAVKNCVSVIKKTTELATIFA